MAQPENGVTDLLCLDRHHEQRLLLIASVHHMQDLRRDVLKNDGVQRLVPPEESPGDKQKNSIEGQDQVPGLHPSFLGKIDGDEICPAAGRVGKQAETDGDPVHQSSEYYDQKRIVGQRRSRDHVRQHTADNDHQKRQDRELLPDKTEPYIHRNGVQDHVDDRIGDICRQIPLGKTLNKYRQPCHSAGKKAACPDEDLEVQGHEHRARQNQKRSPDIPFHLITHISEYSFFRRIRFGFSLTVYLLHK